MGFLFSVCIVFWGSHSVGVLIVFSLRSIPFYIKLRNLFFLYSVGVSKKKLARTCQPKVFKIWRLWIFLFKKSGDLSLNRDILIGLWNKDFVSYGKSSWASKNMHAQQYPARWKQLTLMFLNIISSLWCQNRFFPQDRQQTI